MKPSVCLRPSPPKKGAKILSLDFFHDVGLNHIISLDIIVTINHQPPSRPLVTSFTSFFVVFQASKFAVIDNDTITDNTNFRVTGNLTVDNHESTDSSHFRHLEVSRITASPITFSSILDQASLSWLLPSLR